MAVTETLAAISAGLAVAKSVYELGIEIFPNAKTFVINLITIIQAWVNGEDISDEALATMQAETKAMSEACHAAYVAKYGDSDDGDAA